MEELSTLRIDIPVYIKDIIKADSQALGLPAYKLYIKILEDFIRKTATDRKTIYIRRRRGRKQD